VNGEGIQIAPENKGGSRFYTVKNGSHAFAFNIGVQSMGTILVKKEPDALTRTPFVPRKFGVAVQLLPKSDKFVHGL